MYNVLVFLDVFVSLLLILCILLQNSKGAESGMSSVGGKVFSPVSSANFLTKLTAFLAASFFIISLIIGRLSATNYSQVNFAKKIISYDNVKSQDPSVSDSDSAKPKDSGSSSEGNTKEEDDVPSSSEK